jgi:hypothetical protein
MAPDNSFLQPLGGARQVAYAAADLGIPAATTLGASATVAGNLVANSANLKTVAVSGTSPVASNVILTTFLDAAGTLVLETVTAAAAAGANATALSTKFPFASFKMLIQNTTAGASTCQANAGLGQA